MKGSPLSKPVKDSRKASPKPERPAIQDARESLVIREVPISSPRPGQPGTAPQRASSGGSSGRPSKVFEDLLGRLDKLKETLEISPKGKKPAVGVAFSEHQVVFDENPGSSDSSARKPEVSPHGYQKDDHHSEESDRDLDPKKGPVSFGPEQWETDSGRNDKKSYLNDLEYSPSKKESYTSQIDNFLTNETGGQQRTLSTSRIASTTQRSELTQLGVTEFHKPQPNWTQQVDKDLGSLAELRARYKKKDGVETLNQNEKFLGFQDKENLRPESYLNRQPSSELYKKNYSFTKPRPVNDAVSRALYLVQARHAHEQNKFEQRDMKFQEIKRFLDNQEGGGKKKQNPKQPDPRIKMMHHEVNRLESKLNQYHFTFKDVPETLGERKSSNSRGSDPDVYFDGTKSRNRSQSKQFEEFNQKRVYNHMYESSKASLDEGSPRSRNNHSQSRSQDYMTATRDGLYDSHQYHSKAESIKPPVSFEIPISTSGRHNKQLAVNGTLKDAYNQFVAKKGPRKTTAPKQVQPRANSRTTNHHKVSRESNSYNKSVSPQHQQSLSSYGSSSMLDQFKIGKGIPSTQRANMLQHAREQARNLGLLGGSGSGNPPKIANSGNGHHQAHPGHQNGGMTYNNSNFSNSVTGMLMKTTKDRDMPPVKMREPASRSRSPAAHGGRTQDVPVEIYCKQQPANTAAHHSNSGWGSRNEITRGFELHPMGGSRQHESSRGNSGHQRNNSSHWSNGVLTSEEKNRERARQQRATAVQRRERVKHYDEHRRTVK